MKQKIKLLTAIFVIFTLLFFCVPKNSLAVSFSTISDKMSRQAPSTGADHEIKFTTPVNINQLTDSFTLNFTSGFDLSQIDLADIDFFHGITEELLSNSPTALSWGVEINSGNIVFTHPNSLLNGNINSGEELIIRIGLNATGGDAQIINPATIGSKLMEITSSFGVSSKFAVPVANDQIGISAQYALPPLAITLFPPTNMTTVAMDLTWSVSADPDFSRYELYYSTLPGVNNTTNGILLVTYNTATAATFTATGLTPNTNYYFVVYVYNTADLSAPSNEVTGKTLSAGNNNFIKPAMPTLDQRVCPIFISDYLLTGTRPTDTIVFVNNSSIGVNYPTPSGWSRMATLSLGANVFTIFVRDSAGNQSDTLTDTINRWRKGDTNGNWLVDDYDLSGLAAHFWTDWCFADFNADFYVDDFDLSALATNWDNIY